MQQKFHDILHIIPIASGQVLYKFNLYTLRVRLYSCYIRVTSVCE